MTKLTALDPQRSGECGECCETRWLVIRLDDADGWEEYCRQCYEDEILPYLADKCDNCLEREAAIGFYADTNGEWHDYCWQCYDDCIGDFDEAIG